MHLVLWEKLPKFRKKLRRQGFIMRKNQRRSLRMLDNIRHRKGFPRAGHPEEGLLADIII